MNAVEDDPLHGKPFKERMALRKRAREIDPSIAKLEGYSFFVAVFLFPVVVHFFRKLAPHEPVFVFILSFFACFYAVGIFGGAVITPKIRRALNSVKDGDHDGTATR